MIRHVVLWKLKPEACATPEILQANLAKIRENHRIMDQNSPLILRMELCQSVRQGEDIYEFGAIMDFASLEALLEYRASPAHLEPEAKAFCDAVRERKATIDYEVPDSAL